MLITASRGPAGRGAPHADPLGSETIQSIARIGLSRPGVLRDDEIQAICRSVLAHGVARPVTVATPAPAAVRPVADRPHGLGALRAPVARPGVVAQHGLKRRYQLYAQAAEQG